MRALLIAVLWLLAPAAALAAPAGQDEFLQGLALDYQPEGQPDYQAAAAFYEQAAALGSREALLALARLSAPDRPLWQSPEAWGQRLRAAAAAGWPEAAYYLAQSLESGFINPRPDDEPPLSLYIQAASAGFGPAALRLGRLYRQGGADLAQPDKGRAAMWFLVAAENQETEAYLALGQLYYESDPEAAIDWLSRSPDPQAAWLLGQLYLSQRRVVEALSSFSSAADRGHAPSHLALGLLNLENDYGLRPDPRQAIRHLKVAAQAGLAEGAYHLAQMFLHGRATPKDPITGAYWLHRAAEKDFPGAAVEYERLSGNFSAGQKKRLERMIEEDKVPSMRAPAQ